MSERLKVILGDIHGEYLTINRWFKKTKLTDVDIFQVGDFGFGFYHNDPKKKKKEYKELKNLNEF